MADFVIFGQFAQQFQIVIRQFPGTGGKFVGQFAGQHEGALQASLLLGEALFEVGQIRLGLIFLFLDRCLALEQFVMMFVEPQPGAAGLRLVPGKLSVKLRFAAIQFALTRFQVRGQLIGLGAELLHDGGGELPVVCGILRIQLIFRVPQRRGQLRRQSFCFQRIAGVGRCMFGLRRRLSRCIFTAARDFMCRIKPRRPNRSGFGCDRCFGTFGGFDLGHAVQGSGFGVRESRCLVFDV